MEITRTNELLFFPLFLNIQQSMTLKDAIKSSLTILKQVMEEKLNATNIEVCSWVLDSWYHYYKVSVDIQNVSISDLFKEHLLSCTFAFKRKKKWKQQL